MDSGRIYLPTLRFISDGEVTVHMSVANSTDSPLNTMAEANGLKASSLFRRSMDTLPAGG
jgi:hypothetical protein